MVDSVTPTVARLSIGGVQVILFKYLRSLKYLPGDAWNLDRSTRARFEYWLVTGEELDPSWEVFSESHSDNDSRLQGFEHLCMFVCKESRYMFEMEGYDRNKSQWYLEPLLFYTFDLGRKPSAEEISDKFIRPWINLLKRCRDVD